MEGLWISYEKIGPFGDSIEVIDPHAILAKVKAENGEGKYALFCSNHIRSKKLLPEQDFFLTKKYLLKQWISIMPVNLVNHYNLGGIIGKTANAISDAFQKPFLSDTWRIKVYANAGRKVSFDRQREGFKNNENEFADPKISQNNIRISPYEDTYMHISGRQDFLYDAIDARIGERETTLANTFAKENRFPWHDIIPLYIYEDKIGKFYMSVGDPIKKEGKKVNDIKLAYLESMQALKEQTLAHVAEKGSK